MSGIRKISTVLPTKTSISVKNGPFTSLSAVSALRVATVRMNSSAANSCFSVPLLTISRTYGWPASRTMSCGVKDISASSIVTVFFASQSAAFTNSAALATYCSPAGASLAGGGVAVASTGGGVAGGGLVSTGPAVEQAARTSVDATRKVRIRAIRLMAYLLNLGIGTGDACVAAIVHQASGGHIR